VLPRFRRRGIQQALMAARLEHAASRGARFATIGARPGIPTNRNAMRMGFRLAYTKVVLVKPGPALVSVRH
jgi:GNAT superfamily N-acetyltransferase